MDKSSMELIHDVYIKLLKHGHSIYTESSNSNTIDSAQKLESYSTYLKQMNDKLKTILDLTSMYAKECNNKADEIREIIDINSRNADDPSKMFLAYKEMHKGMSWADITEIEDEKELVLKAVNKAITGPNKSEYSHANIMYKDLSKIYGKDIGFDCKIPIINKLNEMPSALYWYDGDQKNPQGIYTCVSRKFYVQVPFPNVVDGTKDFNRTRSIKCKYNTTDECLELRRDLATRYNYKIRDCNFAHSGDKYTKIGTSFRCPNIPRFGNHMFLKQDLENLPDCDIKMLLMYSLSDVLLSSLWFQKQKDASIVFTNIDTC